MSKIVKMYLITLTLCFVFLAVYTARDYTYDRHVDYKKQEQMFLMDFDKDQSEFTIYDSGDLTAEIIENRNGNLIVERCIGIVANSNTGDGVLLNIEGNNCYISYSNIEEINSGDIIVSYMVYSTTNNFIDGISERYDYIV